MIGNIVKKCKNIYQRVLNQRRAYDFPGQSGGWEKCKNNPLIGTDETGSMFDPFVRLVDGKYVMCVSKRKNHTLVLYSSIDGVHWENEREILKGIAESEWQTMVNRGCFLVKDGKWYLWYTGQNEGKSKIGLAISTDGVNYTRASENPVLVPEFRHEGISVMNPCVMWDDEKNIFKMWYAAGENYEPDVLCYAESVDGIQWEKIKHPILMSDKTKKYQQYKVGACDVVKLPSGKYCMAYIAYQNINVARICIAYSDNGIIDWKADENNPILAPDKYAWDGHSVYKPTICLDYEKVRTLLWYNGRVNRSEKIGCAVINRFL